MTTEETEKPQNEDRHGASDALKELLNIAAEKLRKRGYEVEINVRKTPIFICPFCGEQSEPWRVMCCDMLTNDTRQKIADLTARGVLRGKD